MLHSASAPTMKTAMSFDANSTATFGRRSMSGAASFANSAGLKRHTSAGALFSPPLEQRIDSTWAIGGKKARMLEKRPHTHGLRQFYQSPFDRSYAKIFQEKNLRLLESLFYEADEDGSGTMDVDEFTKSLCNENIRDAFSRLGIQPHQSDLVFRTLDVKRAGELSIQEFMDGLHTIVGELDFSAQAKELDIESLRPARRKKDGSEATNGSGHDKSGGLPAIISGGSQQQLHRAFVHSALAQALHPATAKRKAQPRLRR